MALIKTKGGQEFFVQSEVLPHDEGGAGVSSGTPPRLAVRALNNERTFKSVFEAADLLTVVSKKLVSSVEVTAFAHALIAGASVGGRPSAFSIVEELRPFDRAEFTMAVPRDAEDPGTARLVCTIFQPGKERGAKVLDLTLSQAPRGAEYVSRSALTP